MHQFCQLALNVFMSIQQMGAAESQGISKSLQLDHPYLQTPKILKKNNQRYLQAVALCQKPQYQQWNRAVQTYRETSAGEDYLFVPLKYKFEEGGVCSTNGELKMEFEYFPRLLETEIKDRIKERKRFTEGELWYLLYAMVAARQALVLQGKQFGDLNPQNIFLNVDQTIRIAGPLSWPNHMSAFRKAVLQQSFQYLSPQDIVRLRLGAMDNKTNTESQIFIMGLTMLAASCLQPMKDIYRMKDRDMDQVLFGARLAVFRQDPFYSVIFRATVSNLLEMDPLKRMNQFQLTQFLFKHKDYLQTKRPLMFDNVGQKLQLSLNNLLQILNQQAPAPVQSMVKRVSSRQLPHLNNSPDKPHSSKHINFNDVNQEAALRESKLKEREIMMTSRPVYDGSRAIPVSPNSRKLVFVSPARNGGPPVPLYMPTRNNMPSQEKIITSPKNQQLRGSQQRQQPQPQIQQMRPQSNEAAPNHNNRQHFKPFETVNSNKNIPGPSQAQKSPEKPADILQSNVQRVIRKQSDTSESLSNPSMVGQLLVQTKKGDFQPNKTASERQNKSISFGDHSFMNNSKDSQIVIERDSQYNRTSNDVSKRHSNQPQEQKVKETPQQRQLQALPQQRELSPSQQKEARKDDPISWVAASNKIINNQKLLTNSLETIETSPQKTAQRDKSYSQGSSNESKGEPQKLSTSVKIWGASKGKLTVQEIGGSQTNLQRPNTDGHSESYQSSPFSSPKKDSEDKESVTPAEGQTAQEYRVGDEYILIQEPSRTTTQKGSGESDVRQKRVQQLKSNTDGTYNQTQKNQGAKNTGFIFVEHATEGTFQECWKELMNMLKEPQNYCSEIKAQKVQPLENQYGQFLRVGPLKARIHLNQQQGKVWVQNLASSQCKGDLFCGVFKKVDRFHYIWVNSSLTYKDQYFPSSSLIDQALQKARDKIDGSVYW